MTAKIADIRKDYDRQILDKEHVDPNPLRQFERWFSEALAGGFREPTAMSLATVSAEGQPSVRMVLLKDFDRRGFVFYTNYQSRKGMELANNPRAALLFWWDCLERQIRIEGRTEKIDGRVSNTYFSSRPRESQMAAWASEQSKVIDNRQVLEDRMAVFLESSAGHKIVRPDFWGGYRLIPAVFEFWQGRENRLHDRLRYRSGTAGKWIVERLAP